MILKHVCFYSLRGDQHRNLAVLIVSINSGALAQKFQIGQIFPPFCKGLILFEEKTFRGIFNCSVILYNKGIFLLYLFRMCIRKKLNDLL
jgi:hypothetical protein